MTFKKLCPLFIIVVMLFFSACSLNSKIPHGYIQKQEYFDENGFQDYTDYCKYYYNDTSKVEKNKNFQKLTAEQVQNTQHYFEDFAKFMEAQGRLEEYDFSLSCIDEGDYVYKLKAAYDDYTILFFDTQSCILYYIHNNI